MSTNPIYDQLDDAVTNGLAPDGSDDTSDRFVIEDEAQAEWALRKLARYARDRQTKVDVAQAEKARIDAWLEDETGKLDRHADYFRSILADYMRRRHEDDPKVKTLSLPSGTLKARKGRPRVTVTDLDALEAWVDEHEAGELLRVKVEADKRAILGRVEVDGEVPPGVEIEPGGVSFTADPDVT
jgi:phage host-nuclease inhibitor protein Gam